MFQKMMGHQGGLLASELDLSSHPSPLFPPKPLMALLPYPAYLPVKYIWPKDIKLPQAVGKKELFLILCQRVQSVYLRTIFKNLIIDCYWPTVRPQVSESV